MTEVLLALFKRNYNVPELQGLCYEQDIIDECAERFFNSYVPEQNTGFLQECSNSPIYPSSMDIEDWLNDQPSSVRGLVEKDVRSIFEKPLNEYDLSIKKQPKPPLDMTAINTYSSLQTIIAHSKDINAIFCPIFKRFEID